MAPNKANDTDLEAQVSSTAPPAARHARLAIPDDAEDEKTTTGVSSSSNEGGVPLAKANTGGSSSDDAAGLDATLRKRVMTADQSEGGGLGGPNAGPPRRATMDTSGTEVERRGLARTFTELLTPEHRLAPAPTTLQSIKNIICFSWLNLLLIFIPVSWALNFTVDSPIARFTTACEFFRVHGRLFYRSDSDERSPTKVLAIIPLAQMLSFGTEEIAIRVGETLGGLINASLGNAVELIVAIIALVKCELTIVQTSLIGSVLSNILLVLGMCFFAGGLRFKEQQFQVTAAQINSSLLVMATIIVIIPAGYHSVLGANINNQTEADDILKFSRGVALILLSIYACYLFFVLSSHKHLFVGESEEEEPQLTGACALGLLVIATVLIGVTSDFLVDSINGIADPTQYPGAPNKTWIGLILLPIVSNAAEHATAVTVAVKDKLDLSMGVAVGSSIQISIFVIPLLVVIGWIANKPLSLLFDPFVAIYLFLSVLIVNSAIQDGKTNWLEGYLLMMVYVSCLAPFFQACVAY